MTAKSSTIQACLAIAAFLACTPAAATACRDLETHQYPKGVLTLDQLTDRPSRSAVLALPTIPQEALYEPDIGQLTFNTSAFQGNGSCPGTGSIDKERLALVCIRATHPPDASSEIRNIKLIFSIPAGSPPSLFSFFATEPTAATLRQRAVLLLPLSSAKISKDPLSQEMHIRLQPRCLALADPITQKIFQRLPL